MTFRAYVMSVRRGTIRELAQGMGVVTAWSDDKLYVSGLDLNGRSFPIQVYDVRTDNLSQLPLGGVAVAASPVGDYLVVTCDPADPGRTVTLDEVESLTVCALSPEGEVLGEIGREAAVGNYVLSPNGRYMAVQPRRQDDSGPPGASGTRILTMPGGEVAWEAGETGMLLAVRDDGTLITAAVAESGGTASILHISPTGEKTKLVPSAVAPACVADDRLFYVPLGDPLRLRAMPLPRHSAGAGKYR